MKYRTEHTPTKDFKQSFTEFVDDFQLILRDDKLYKSDTPINRQKLIESSRETALTNALEKFLPEKVTEDNETIVEYNRRNTDLDDLMNAENLANEYREKFNLPDSMSTMQVYDFLTAQQLKLKESLSKFKEVNSNETKTKENAEENK